MKKNDDYFLNTNKAYAGELLEYIDAPEERYKKYQSIRRGILIGNILLFIAMMIGLYLGKGVPAMYVIGGFMLGMMHGTYNSIESIYQNTYKATRYIDRQRLVDDITKNPTDNTPV